MLGSRVELTLTIYSLQHSEHLSSIPWDLIAESFLVEESLRGRETRAQAMVIYFPVIDYCPSPYLLLLFVRVFHGSLLSGGKIEGQQYVII